MFYFRVLILVDCLWDVTRPLLEQRTISSFLSHRVFPVSRTTYWSICFLLSGHFSSAFLVFLLLDTWAFLVSVLFSLYFRFAFYKFVRAFMLQFLLLYLTSPISLLDHLSPDQIVSHRVESQIHVSNLSLFILHILCIYPTSDLTSPLMFEENSEMVWRGPSVIIMHFP